jgi:hypothetical protein
MTFYISLLFENLSRKLNFLYNTTRIRGTSHVDLSIFMIPRLIFLRVRSVSDKSHRKNKNVSCSVTFFSKSLPFVTQYGKMCKTRQATDDNTANALCMLDN